MRKIDPKNCFAYNRNTRTCTACTEMICERKECPFYKTRTQIEKAQGESAMRLLHMAEDNPKLADRIMSYGLSITRLQKIAGRSLLHETLMGGESSDG